MKQLSFLNIMYNLLMAVLIGAVGGLAGLNAVGVTVGVLMLGVTYSVFTVQGRRNWGRLALFGAIQVEIWKDTIEEEIRKDNAFLFSSTDSVDKENILQGKVVYLPQSGGSGNVHKNPTNFPLSVREREDNTVHYVLDLYATEPVRIAKVDEAELSYDKRVSVLGEDLAKLKEVVADNMIHNWLKTPAYGQNNASVLPSTQIIAVTGDNGTSNAEAPGASGNRKKASLTDLQNMQTLFRQQNRWFEGRMYALLTPVMIAEIAPADSVVTATYMQSVTEQERREGVYMKIQGWKIMVRSTVAAVAADGTTIRTPDEAGESTDHAAALFYYKGALETAIGEIDVFDDQKNPLYLGDVYNFSIRSGGRSKRSDYKGVALLRQAATA
jgi:hypothetical protein